MTFILGRHIIGYEVQKVLAAVDWFAKSAPRTPISVYGYGEGGLLSLYSAAADERIESAVVSGYFRNRRRLWEEPIYRNVWNLIPEFEDAQLARLIAPRRLIVEAAPHPNVNGPPPERAGRRGAAPGRITTPPIEEVRAEVRRAGVNVTLIENPGDATLASLLGRPASASVPPAISTDGAGPRQERQFRQLVAHTQALVRTSEVLPNIRKRSLLKGSRGK